MWAAADVLLFARFIHRSVYGYLYFISRRKLAKGRVKADCGMHRPSEAHTAWPRRTLAALVLLHNESLGSICPTGQTDGRTDTKPMCTAFRFGRGQRIIIHTYSYSTSCASKWQRSQLQLDVLRSRSALTDVDRSGDIHLNILSTAGSPHQRRWQQQQQQRS